MTFRWLLAMALVGGVAFACGEDDSGGGDDDDAPAGECPTDLSYAKVGKPFIERYCSDCHGSDADESLRGGIEDAVFATEAQVREHGGHIHERVVLEEDMPPKNETQPSDSERENFAKWLDCSGIADEEHDH